MYWYSPHTRGWTYCSQSSKSIVPIFPAYAGLNLGLFYISFSKLDIPRIRGVEPKRLTISTIMRKYSPHTRGWTCEVVARFSKRIIFPAYAGLNPTHDKDNKDLSNIPRIRGVEPASNKVCVLFVPYSPHTRGWTRLSCTPYFRLCIFPAYAGLNLTLWFSCLWLMNIPRIRGVEPNEIQINKYNYGYSPHTRGWTLNMII